MLRTALAVSLLLATLGCGPAEPAVTPAPAPTAVSAKALEAARTRMIEEQVRPMKVTSEPVLRAMATVPRHEFLPAELWPRAYLDQAVRRPDGETLTAPDLSAAMLECLALRPDDRVLECGTRSGWLTALLGAVAGEVYTVDARPAASEKARRTLAGIGIGNVRFRVGDPLGGWAEEAPFDAVVVNGAVPHVPRRLYAMLAPGGRILAPVGDVGERQTLILSVRGDREPVSTRPILTVRFGALPRE